MFGIITQKDQVDFLLLFPKIHTHLHVKNKQTFPQFICSEISIKYGISEVKLYCARC